jgi:hypothetical protein
MGTLMFKEGSFLYFMGTLVFKEGNFLYFMGTLVFKEGSFLYFMGTLVFKEGTPKLVNPVAKCKTAAGDPKCLILKILPKPLDIRQKTFKYIYTNENSGR